MAYFVKPQKNGKLCGNYEKVHRLFKHNQGRRTLMSNKRAKIAIPFLHTSRPLDAPCHHSPHLTPGISPLFLGNRATTSPVAAIHGENALNEPVFVEMQNECLTKGSDHHLDVGIVSPSLQYGQQARK